MKKLIDSNKIAIDYDFSGMSNYLIVTVKNSSDIVNEHLKILLERKISCFLPVKKIQLNNSIQLYYDITNKATLSQFLKNDVFTKTGLIDLLNKIIDAIDETKKVDLVDRCIILDRKYIFTETITSKPLFVYLPFYTESSGLSIIANFLNSLKEGNNLDFDHNEYFNLIVNKCLDNKTTTQDLRLLFAQILKNTSKSTNNAIIYRPQKKEEKVKDFDRYNSEKSRQANFEQETKKQESKILEHEPIQKLENITQIPDEHKVIDIMPLELETTLVETTTVEPKLHNIGDFLNNNQEDEIIGTEMESPSLQAIDDFIIDPISDDTIDEEPQNYFGSESVQETIIEQPVIKEPEIETLDLSLDKSIERNIEPEKNDVQDALSELKARLKNIDKSKPKPEKDPLDQLRITGKPKEDDKTPKAVIKYPIVDLLDADEEKPSRHDDFDKRRSENIVGINDDLEPDDDFENDFLDIRRPSSANKNVVIDPFEIEDEIEDEIDANFDSSLQDDFIKDEFIEEDTDSKDDPFVNTFDNADFNNKEQDDGSIDLSLNSSKSFKAPSDNKMEIVQLILCNLFIIAFFVMIAVLGLFNEFFYSENTSSLNLPSIVVTAFIVLVLESFFIKRIFVDSSEDQPVEKDKKEKQVKEKPIKQKIIKEKPIKEKPVKQKIIKEKPVIKKLSKVAEEKPVEKKLIGKKTIDKKVAEKKPIEKKPIEKKLIEKKSTEKKVVEEKPKIKPLEPKSKQKLKPLEPKAIVEERPKTLKERPVVPDYAIDDIDRLDKPKKPYFGAIIEDKIKEKPPMLGGINSISLDLDNSDAYLDYQGDDLIDLDADNHYSEEILEDNIIDYEGEFKERPSKMPSKKPNLGPDDEILPGIEISNSEKLKKELTSKRLEQEFDITETAIDDTEFVTESKVPFLVTEIGGAMQKIYINKDNFTLGRFVGKVDYVCQSNKVGKVHASIITRNGEYFINDLSSRNGTFINSYQQRNVSNIDYRIKDGDVIILADVEFTFHLE